MEPQGKHGYCFRILGEHDKYFQFVKGEEMETNK